MSGGRFQTAHPTERAIKRLREVGLRPYWHQGFPPNGGGIALEQWRRCPDEIQLKKEEAVCARGSGKILSVRGEDLERTARVSFGGIVKEVSLVYVPEATWVITSSCM